MRERFDEVNVFLSASETHNQHNVNRSVEDSLAGLEATLGRAGEAGLRREGVIAISFGCPYEGEVPAERVLEIAERLAAAGCEEVGFGDTTGMANPRQVHEFFAAARERLAGVELTAHFHNTRGQGLANVLAALEEAVESFESSFGELGGCPVPPGSTGNVSTEDIVSMLHEMGVATGVDLPRLIAASRAAQEVLGRPLGAHVLRAGPVDWQRGSRSISRLTRLATVPGWQLASRHRCSPAWPAPGRSSPLALLAFQVRAGRAPRRQVAGAASTAVPGSTRFDVATVFAHLADPLPMIVMLIAICGLAVHWDRRREALAAVAVVAGANVTTQVLKALLDHHRYQSFLGPDQPWSGAFPSGHATAAASIGVALFLVAPPRLRPLAAVIGASFTALVSVSVVLLEWHYPSDVLGGLLIVAGWGFAAVAALRLRQPAEHAPPAQASSRFAISTK